MCAGENINEVRCSNKKCVQLWELFTTVILQFIVINARSYLQFSIFLKDDPNVTVHIVVGSIYKRQWMQNMYRNRKLFNKRLFF